MLQISTTKRKTSRLAVDWVHIDYRHQKQRETHQDLLLLWDKGEYYKIVKNQKMKFPKADCNKEVTRPSVKEDM